MRNLIRKKFLILFFVLILKSVVLCISSYAEDQRESIATTIDLIECADRQLAFKMFCNPRWPLRRDVGKLIMDIVASPAQDKVSVTVQRLDESGLSFADLTPAALKRVFDYADNFTYAKTKVQWNKAIRVEAQARLNTDCYLLDFFFINDNHLYRISYAAIGKKSYRKYLPLFTEMISSFDFFRKTEN